MLEKFSRAGAWHRENKVENQDVVLSRSNDRFSVITLADGVSTCGRSGAGALAACEAGSRLLLEKAEHFLDFDNEARARLVLSHIVRELKTKAENEQGVLEDYSSTFAAVLVDRRDKRLLYYNLGDGLIMGRSGNEFRIFAPPGDSSRGCCTTTTKNAAVLVQTEVIDVGDLDAVMICSDGAWKVMFDRGHPKPEVKRMIEEYRYDDLEAFFEDRKSNDDYSLILTDLNESCLKEAV